MLTGINPFKTAKELSFVEQMNLILEKQIPIPKHVTIEAQDLLKKLLEKDPKNRIGCRDETHGGVNELKAHPFFRTIDFDAFLLKQVEPPFKPECESESDVQNVANEFLDEMPQETPLEDNAFTKMASEDGDFDNFTYVNGNYLSQMNQSDDLHDGEGDRGTGPISLQVTADSGRAATEKYLYKGGSQDDQNSLQ